MQPFVAKYQSFSDTADKAATPARMAALRLALAEAKLDGFIIPRADAHQNEYTPASEERLVWLTGFTGSAGAAIVLRDKAAIFVDGRYTLQVREQTDPALFEYCDLIAEPPSQWLKRNSAKGARIGFDPWLHTPMQARALREALAAAGAELVAVERNLLDATWTHRPAPPSAPIVLYPEKLAGESAHKKLARVAAALNHDALVLSDPHAVAWAFNIRGGDVAHTPLPLSWAIIRKGARPTLYVEAVKLSNSVRDALEKLADIEPPQRLTRDLEQLGAQGAQVDFDAATAPEKLVALLQAAGGKAHVGAEPIALMKACKNAAELRGARAAHLRDGAAVANFLCWLDAHALKSNEIEAAAALETFRRATGKLKDVSFPTISAAGAHAASPHYRVTNETNIKISRGLFLIDSGAQYVDGTTDITRTIAVGKPTTEMRDRYTRVLKGHIAIATALFPAGATGAQIDAFARQYLWRAGLDFDHGTGHGVGAYLSVHEGPQRISKLGATPLQPGMILSNEPGFYKAGAFGIRIENLVIVEQRKIAGGDRAMLGFETITLAPIDLAPVDKKMLTREEISWLNAYHARVRAALLDKVAPQTRAWLKQATRKI
jgi:Xaa-Pro aminopeptidase